MCEGCGARLERGLGSSRRWSAKAQVWDLSHQVPILVSACTAEMGDTGRCVHLAGLAAPCCGLEEPGSWLGPTFLGHSVSAPAALAGVRDPRAPCAADMCHIPERSSSHPAALTLAARQRLWTHWLNPPIVSEPARCGTGISRVCWQLSLLSHHRMPV